MAQDPHEGGRPPEGRGPAGERRGAVALLETYHRLAPVTVPLYALLLALLVGAVVMLAAGANPFEAYGALFAGAFGNPERIVRTLVRSTPYVVAGIAVALAYRAGLFNIGVEGQLLIGGLTGVWVGTMGALAGLPAILFVPLVLLAGAVGGALWAGIPGVLKARTGAHEVIVTIMLNAIALRLVDWLVTSRDPMLMLDPDASTPRTLDILPAGQLPDLVPGTAVPVGLLLAVAIAAGAWYLVSRSTLGFQIRTVGTNPSAARYAGMSVPRIIVVSMLISGAVAGIGGIIAVNAGDSAHLTPGLLRNVGFDGIAIALIARGNPLAVIPAALLWGSLLSGAPLMQVQADLSIDLVRVVQASVILFVAGDMIVRTLFRIRPERGAGGSPTPAATGWGAQT